MCRRFPVLIAILSVLGLSVSAYSLAHKESVVSGAFCSINDTFSCDIVNRGPYSEILGVPVALIGVLGYGLVAAAALLNLRQPADRGLPVFILLGSVGGLIFSGYLTGIEAFVLRAWCLLCLTSQTIMLSLFASALMLWRCSRRPPPVV